MTPPPDGNEYDIPDDARIYVDQVRARVELLIERSIWEGLHLSTVDYWLNNFIGPKEQYFAAAVLDQLIYRSESQASALVEQIFLRCLPEVSANHPPKTGRLLDWISPLQRRRDPAIRLVPVITSDDPPTKSGFSVIRSIKRQYSFCQDWILWPEKLVESGISRDVVVVFCDDFVGTGKQFKRFVSSHGLEPILSENYCIYAPLAAHEDGVSNIKNEYSSLKVTSADTLDSSHSAFSDTSPVLAGGLNTPQQARNFYDTILGRLASRKHRESRAFTYGFGDLELTYGFSHGTPNSSLSILWYDYPEFVPLLDR